MKKFYSEISKEFVDEFNALVNESDRVLITSHLSPDDDSISSVLGTYLYLTQYMNKNNVEIIYTGTKSKRWEYFESYKNVHFIDDIAEIIGNYDLVIFVDGNNWGRFSTNNKPDNFPKSICIDHHPIVNSEFDLHLLVEDSPATASLIYKLFFANVNDLPKDICEVILLGIIGDTGSYRYIDYSQSDIFAISERLIREGKINVNELQASYNIVSDKIFSAFQQLINNCFIRKVGKWPKFMVTYLSKSYVVENMLTNNEVREASNLVTEQLLIVENVKWGFVVTPRDNVSSASFRSMPNSINVRLVAEGMNGGGQDQTAGAKFDTDNVEDVINQIHKWLENNDPVRL